jgi:hypothetical protein
MATPSVPLLPGGESTTLDAAGTGVSFAILVPNSPPATAEALGKVWLDRQDDVVALEYSSGNVHIVESPAAYKNANSYFQSIIDDGGAKNSLTTLRGFPAIAIQGNTDAYSSNPSWFEVDFGGVDVSISSADYSIDTLASIAASLNERPAG